MRVDVISAADPATVAAAAEVINRAYAAGERGLWRDGIRRIAPEAVATAIGAGELLGATDDGRLAGCARVWPIDAATWEIGLISVDPDAWGGGAGRALVAAGEARMRAAGATTAQLHLLVPAGRPHPEKERLRAWYLRLGYAVVRTAPFEEVASHGAGDLATPCAFLVFRKPLA